MSPVAQHPVVTGTGVCWGDARSVDDFWDRIADTDGSTDLWALVDGVMTLPVREIDPSIDYRARRRASLTATMAVSAARMAVRSAGLVVSDPSRAAIIIGVAANGTIDHGAAAMADQLDIDPMLCCKATGSEAAAAIARDLGWTGPAWSVGTACSAGNDAIALGFDWLRMGRADVVIVGGSDAACTFAATQSVWRLGVAAADGRCRPFDRSAHGFLMTEGSAALVLETAEHAARRGATVLAQVSGWGSSCDAYHEAKPHPDGTVALQAIDQALAAADLRAESISVYAAHGTGTHANDSVEASLVAARFPTSRVIATKGVTGHPFGASAALEAVVVVEAIRRALLPPVWGTNDPIDVMADRLVLRLAQPWLPAPVLSASFGLGGVNTAVVFEPCDGGTD